MLAFSLITAASTLPLSAQQAFSTSATEKTHRNCCGVFLLQHCYRAKCFAQWTNTTTGPGMGRATHAADLGAIDLQVRSEAAHRPLERALVCPGFHEGVRSVVLRAHARRRLSRGANHHREQHKHGGTGRKNSFLKLSMKPTAATTTKCASSLPRCMSGKKLETPRAKEMGAG